MCLLPRLGVCESFIQSHIFSLDLDYLRTGLENSGFGIGLTYERMLVDFLSLKGGFSHMVMWPKRESFVLTTVGVKLAAFYYPLSSGMQGLFIGPEMSTDFLMYTGQNKPLDHDQDSLIAITPTLGWKQSIYELLFVDVFIGWRMNITSPALPSGLKSHYDTGFVYGFNFKFNTEELWSRLFST